MRKIQQLLLPLAYLAVGGLVTFLLVRRILSLDEMIWVWLLLPGVALTVLLMVVGLVNSWLEIRSSMRDDMGMPLQPAQLVWLYLRGWLIIMSALTVEVLFCWLWPLIPAYVHDLTADFVWLFHAATWLLTVSALYSIVRSLYLAEERLRSTQAENQLLKAQLNPHFLYNTLNNIDALIWTDADRASEAVVSLSQLMRYMTYSARQDRVRLDEEVKALEQLCALQQLRCQHPEAVRLTCTTSAPAVTLAPLLLLPLAENCFKHCGATDEAEAVVITLQVSTQQLRFATDNNLPLAPSPASDSSHGGVGLVTLRRRLEMLYPRRYTFTTETVAGRFRATLLLSL